MFWMQGVFDSAKSERFNDVEQAIPQQLPPYFPQAYLCFWVAVQICKGFFTVLNLVVKLAKKSTVSQQSMFTMVSWLLAVQTSVSLFESTYSISQGLLLQMTSRASWPPDVPAWKPGVIQE